MLNQINGRHYYNLVDYGIRNLALQKDYINDLNVFPVPDGDTGTNMVMTLQNGFESMSQEEECLSALAKQFAKSIVFGARGNSGVIVSQFFKGFSESLATAGEEADKFAFVLAMESGVAAAYRAVSNPVEGTVLTVVREATQMARREVEGLADICETVHCLLSEARNSLERTPELLPILKSAGVVDSGGAGMVYVLEGMEKYLTGQTIAAVATANAPATPKIDFSRYNKKSVFKYGYCTEVLLQLTEGGEPFAADLFRSQLEALGDSVVTVVEDDKVKVHIHTHTPEVILTFCHRFGEFLTLKIENMNVQHSESAAEEKKAPKAEKPRVMKDFGTVAVASGDGIADLFRQLGVDAIVSGGQTQNPSAQDFLAAFEEVYAKHIFVFPNNGNIVMAAKQAAGLWEAGEVHVIESKDLGKGYAAISSMNFQSGDPEAIAEMFTVAMDMVTTGYVCPSIRDAELNGVHIECGDFIGFVGKEMLVSEKDVVTAAKNLLAKMGGEDIYLITAFVGKDASADDVAALEAHVADVYPDAEFYTVEGGQDVYPFIFVVE